MAPPAKIYGNQLLSCLSRKDFALVAPKLTFKEFGPRHRIEEPNRPIREVYFLERGLASMVANSVGNGEVEVGLIGREGVTGTALLLQRPLPAFDLRSACGRRPFDESSGFPCTRFRERIFSGVDDEVRA